MREYVDKYTAFAYPSLIWAICQQLAVFFANYGADVVASPARELSQYVAFHLKNLSGREVRSVYLMKKTEPIVDPRGLKRTCYAETGRLVLHESHRRLVERRKVLYIEDTINTGYTTRAGLHVIDGTLGAIVGVGAVWNRYGVTAAALGVPSLIAVVDERLDTWTEEECARTGPCSKGIEIDASVGHGAEFLERKK